MNSDHNPVVVNVNMKLKKTNATKRSEQLERQGKNNSLCF